MTTVQVPSPQQFDEILAWLKREQEEEYEGFYCKKDMLLESFHVSQMRCVLSGGKAVGFGIYSLWTTSASIDILEIHPRHRGKGLGTHLSRHLIEHLFGLGANRVTVQCTSESAAVFWRRLGFLQESSPNRAGEAFRFAIGRHNP